ncbi:MAG: hypothetical protein PUK29_05990 [Fibrobacter sp.]|uniref:hypothetical protein n=1 Tax=Fibrobacter sp. TaxID=35828 RepID=UPI0025C6F43D|nr:hypothetical protein [Fibrobacter sp.]MDD7497793.1 hypothetical protein [Fibrobacter sp.]
MVPMKVSESIEAHLCSAVAAIAQRNQATLSGKISGHPIFLISVFNRLYRLAKAFGFCLYFLLSLSFWSLAEAIESIAFDPTALTGLQGDNSTKHFHYTASNI